jgi:hypothetical protein
MTLVDIYLRLRTRNPEIPAIAGKVSFREKAGLNASISCWYCSQASRAEHCSLL